MLNNKIIICGNKKCNKRRECYRAQEVNHMADAIYSFCQYEKCPDNNYNKLIKIKGEEIIMKISNITDITGFFKALEKCAGNVYLTTDDGDNLNLKSKLSQYIAFSSIFDEGMIDNINIKFENSEDARLIVHYLIEG